MKYLNETFYGKTPEFKAGEVFLDVDGDLCMVVKTEAWAGKRVKAGALAVLCIPANEVGAPWLRYVETQTEFDAEFGGCQVLPPGTVLNIQV